MSESLIYELSSPGRRGTPTPKLDVPEAELPAGLVREDLPLPEVSEIEVVRHFLRLSQLNYAIDKGIYPLGSCTMKYNPKINEVTARLPGFTGAHPHQPEGLAQGALRLMYELQEHLAKIGGFAGVTLQPAAGAQGELVGVLIMRAYHRARGDTQRDTILVPDSAHGTNPASTSMSGLRVVQIPSDKRGNVDLDALRSQVCDRVVGLMITNPNTLGLFEENIEEIVGIVHGCGGLVYGDGANMNALIGVVRPGDIGIDVMHYNLHKTFSTPHGGGGPGAGPVGVAAHLIDFLPDPVVVREGTDAEPHYRFHRPSQSIGRVRSFWGHFGILVRAYTYIRMHGSEGLRNVAEHAVLNANYLRCRVRDTYHVPYDRMCMHEFVAEGRISGTGSTAMDVSKRLIDYGVHPPTMYFPLIVHDALMIEPTETEPLRTVDAYAETLLRIAEEAVSDPALLHEAPHVAPVRRLDEVQAARTPVLRYRRQP